VIGQQRTGSRHPKTDIRAGAERLGAATKFSVEEEKKYERGGKHTFAEFVHSTQKRRELEEKERKGAKRKTNKNYGNET